MPNKKTKKQLQAEGKSKEEIDAYFGINERTGRKLKWTEERAIALGNEIIDWLKEKETNVRYGYFISIEKDMDPSVVAHLQKMYKSFSQLMQRAKKIQEEKLVKSLIVANEVTHTEGIYKRSIDNTTQFRAGEKKSTTKINPKSIEFLLKTKHGYMNEESRQKIEIERERLELLKQEKSGGGVLDKVSQFMQSLNIGTSKDEKGKS